MLSLIIYIKQNISQKSTIFKHLYKIETFCLFYCILTINFDIIYYNNGHTKILIQKKGTLL